MSFNVFYLFKVILKIGDNVPLSEIMLDYKGICSMRCAFRIGCFVVLMLVRAVS